MTAPALELRAGGRPASAPASASPTRYQHTVRPVLDQSGAWLQFECHGGAEAPCQVSCPQPECALGCTNPAHPGRTLLGGCVLINWITDDDPFFWYGGPRVELRSGPIYFIWTNPGYLWRFAGNQGGNL
ncbi:Uncharacterised protein [Mycobacteroides abscessus subsp. abscessus]|uniref:hypothetical protein n=1 Tax=Mycobacteroides abscessus TaxID=36809 RepID=UPI0009293B9C|nr:hypothetical protein [Mycobacteroides abscessus]SIJ20699.1 Uncharacterised protein [Mycobacteroides abscessus subsp. abscessus]SLH39570.1 Uncharacterised protein [Mycobacteroides abscessus subsp. abscessus]